MQNRLHLTIIFLFVIILSAQAQFAIRYQVLPPKPADSVDIAYYSQKKGLAAATQNFSINMGLWAFNRYVAKQQYAYINIKTIRKNLKHKWVWDNDDMGNNMFLHPYHGNLYFNSARSRGYNYWESGLFTLGGSAMWELFMENEYPSVNDIMATPIGGLALGEVFYRTSDLVLDDRKVGMNRFGRELAGFIIAPTRGLTRVLNGDAWRTRSTSGKQFGVPDVSVEISAGVRALELKGEILDKGVGAAMDINIEYGDRFSTENKKPYDYFTFRSNLNGHGSQPILSQLNILGRLYVTDLIDSQKDFLSLGFYQHFDYYDSDTISDTSNKIPYKFCTPASAGVGLIYQSKRVRNVSFDAFLHANLVFLGGALSDHYVVDMRNYNLASGFSTKTGFNLAYKDKISVSGNYEIYRMFTWKGYPQDVDWENINVHEFDYQGDRSQAILHAISLRADLKLHNHLFLTGIGYNYTRDTNYRYFDDVFSSTYEGRLMLTYKF
ncbi:hypothetical protein M2451_000050 [Dysgonomonas sp. PFB1-18]|uniref:DUF3943 domain-containing protein n=1 Tax=unclassified Dysgonomonas TaxID=2630389 RepID=UPI0024755CE8|nr:MULTISPECIES: DUF3943 domain-containing protein [unclassified Dysgonomonas]MDH6307600.1 hypothetical protein [Dysgonomonas sp. PF1-14]MDH6337518.1 hypothetical protein [Dysgonomonas sp. PF1-16]MDH6378743.1 hypothetical protein [Dysgonomonas sp. PFB1-18]MDH6399161.1 hypothetical protein [Dysgonomonas sp. PF1-23]